VSRETISGTALLERRTVHVRDIEAEGNAFPISWESLRRTGYRTQVATPLLRDCISITIAPPDRIAKPDPTSFRIVSAHQHGNSTHSTADEMRLTSQRRNSGDLAVQG